MRLSERMEKMQDRELLRLMELAEAPDMISFAGGFPSPITYPIKEIREAFLEVLDHHGNEALSYSSTSGYVNLREKISNRMNLRHGTSLKADEIMITSGSQQALDMTGMLFIDKGDIVLCETPSYLGALNAFKAYGAEFIEVPTDKDGIIPEELKKIVEQYGDRIKLVYVIPDFQNPTCRCWTAKRRKEFMQIMQAYDIAILEDAAYYEIAYEDMERPPLISLDTKGQVIYCGSFSKIFCPGFRVAWICSREKMIDKYLLLKPNIDLSSSAINQRVIDSYMEKYSLDNHIEKIIKVYKSRRDLAIETMRRSFPQNVQFEIPKGGLFAWVELPESKNARDLLELALQSKVAFVPGGSFYTKGGRENAFRLNYSNMSEDRIVKGIEILGEIIKKFIQE